MLDLQRQRMIAAAALAGALALAATGATASAAGTTRWVDDDGHAGPTSCAGGASASRSIQSAVDKSRNGDSIAICSGTYPGFVIIKGHTGLSLRAAGQGPSVLMPSLPTGNHPAVITIKNSSGVQVQGLTVKIPSTWNGTCRFYLRGVAIWDSSDIRILDGRFVGIGRDTRNCGMNGAIFADRDKDVVVSRNVLIDFQRFGIWLESSTGSITDNTLRFLQRRQIDQRPKAQHSFGLKAQSGIVSITDNVVGSDPRQDNRDLWLDEGIVLFGGTQTATGNTVSRALVSVDINGIHDAADHSHSSIDSNVLAWGTTGIRLMRSTGAGISGNHVSWFTGRGIVAKGSQDNRITGNVLQHDDTGGTVDCTDDSSGTGTAGTANQWSDNEADGSTPHNLCGPA